MNSVIHDDADGDRDHHGSAKPDIAVEISPQTEQQHRRDKVWHKTNYTE